MKNNNAQIKYGSAFVWALSLTCCLFFFLSITPQNALAEKAANKPAGKGAIARGAQVEGSKKRTRFIAQLSREVPFRIFTLADPYRVIIDMPDVQFQLPDGQGTKGKGLISAFRYGLFAKGKSRIVIDVTAPVKVEQIFIVKKGKQDYARLVVDLVPTDRKSFLKISKKLRSSRAKTDKNTKTSDQKKEHKDLAAPTKKGLPVVVIDPGHGGIDPGAISRSGTREKTIVLKFAKELRDKINKVGKYKAILTRENDIFIPLPERVEIARRLKASLFISVHADSLPKHLSRKIRGATVYTLSEKGSDQESDVLAARENKADILAGVDLPPQNTEVTSILIELAQRETKNLSVAFASGVMEEMGNYTQLHVNRVRSANFRVLKAPDIPSVLIEIGYLSNFKDEKLMKSRKWRLNVTKAIAKEIDQFLSHKVAHSPF